ncbi:MAG: hypothetical protein Q8O43_08085 [Dehalococcoidia bacterium]|nr:hypothetical protein [Dehalococcoidia bacterium]
MKTGGGKKQAGSCAPSTRSDTDAPCLNRRLLLAGVFLISLSLLALEITFTRLLSVLLYYHYVFIVVSLALLGLGGGAILMHFIGLRKVASSSRYTLFATLYTISIPVSLILMLQVPNFTGGANVFPYLALLFIPFFLAGAFFAGVFTAIPSVSSRLYAADLAGAALGSLLVIFLLGNLGGVSSALLLAVVASIASITVTIAVNGRNFKHLLAPATSCIIAVTLFASSAGGFFLTEIPTRWSEDKEMSKLVTDSSAGAKIVETRWSAFGRTDLVSIASTPETMNLYVDGTAGTSMYRFNGDADNPDPAIAELKTTFPGYLPFSTLRENERDNALLIGPGGGRDVLLALLGNVRNITAVEINRDLVDIVKGYDEYNGGIYSGRDDVSIVVADGRNFLKRHEGKYDIIFFSIPVTKTSRSLEGYLLTESFLFTTEAISDYLEHLTDEGRLIIVAHTPGEIFRLISLSIAAMEQQGLDDTAATSRIYTIGAHIFPTLVVKKSPVQKAESEAIHKSLHELGYELASSFLPVLKVESCPPHEVTPPRFDECNMLNGPLVAVSKGLVTFEQLEDALAQQRVDISPVTDDSPFFYNFARGLPGPVTNVFWPSVLVLSAVIAGPMVIKRRLKANGSGRTSVSRPDLFSFAAFFTAIGAGFMLVEISTIQKFTLFLGQPVLSLSLVLFSLLLGAGTGSMFSGRFNTSKSIALLAVVSISVVGLLVVYALFLSPLLEQLLGLSLTLRVITTLVLVVPPGFAMGFFFPAGIRLLKERGLERYIPWMWGINGIASVAGSALTMIAAVSTGFTLALLLGAGFYGIVFVIIGTRFHRLNARNVAH